MKNKKIARTTLIICASLTPIIALFIFVARSVYTLTHDFEFLKTSTSDYSVYLNKDPKVKYSVSLAEGDGIFPDMQITDRVVQEFLFRRSGPSEPQLIIYSTVMYNTDEAYNAELARLTSFGIDDYIGLYSVTGGPEGYNVLAMSANDMGFIYAIAPDTPDNTITYVCLQYCNNYVTCDLSSYLPVKYQLEGIDVTK